MTALDCYPTILPLPKRLGSWSGTNTESWLWYELGLSTSVCDMLDESPTAGGQSSIRRLITDVAVLFSTSFHAVVRCDNFAARHHMGS